MTGTADRREGPAPLALVECPHCGEPTVVNALADGSLVCSCPAHRPVPADER
jgi:hypothetical protein